MAKLTIHYVLTTAGQKANLAAGGTGKADRTIDVDLTPELLAAATVDSEGRATYDLQNRRGTSSSAHYFPSVLTPEQAAAEVLRVEAALIEAEKAAAAKAQAEKDAAAARLAEVVAELRSTPASRWSWDRHGWVRAHVAGKEAKRYDLPDDIRKAIDVEDNRRRKASQDADEAEHARKEAAEAARLAERDAWIAAHGSDRLKKGVAAGLLDSMVGVYRSERITVDLGPDWKSWDAVDEDEDNERRNPREAELDALLEARKRWPDEALDVQLRSVRKGADKNDYDSKPGKWRPALMVRLPWERDKWAVRFLDDSVEHRRAAVQ